MRDAIISRLIAEIRASILVLNRPHGGGHNITPEQADERSRGIVQKLLVGFELRELPKPAAVDWGDESGKPVGHGWSCRCDRCADFHLKIKERV